MFRCGARCLLNSFFDGRQRHEHRALLQYRFPKRYCETAVQRGAAGPQRHPQRPGFGVVWWQKLVSCRGRPRTDRTRSPAVVCTLPFCCGGHRPMHAVVLQAALPALAQRNGLPQICLDPFWSLQRKPFETSFSPRTGRFAGHGTHQQPHAGICAFLPKFGGRLFRHACNRPVGRNVFHQTPSRRHHGVGRRCVGGSVQTSGF